MENKTKDTEMLIKAFSLLEDKEECEAFLDDLCTSLEIEEMSRRLVAAEMLSRGCQYAEVVLKTGLSTATISRVSRSLKNGTGYQKILSKLG